MEESSTTITRASKQRVLFFHHGKATRGAAMSLLYTASKLVDSNDFEVFVAFAKPSKEGDKIFSAKGIQPISAPWLCIWHHSEVAYQSWFSWKTYRHLFKVWRSWKRSKKKSLELVKAIKPTIIHLNSMALSSTGAVLIEDNIPFVWHVREPARPTTGWRHSFISKLLLSAPTTIFLTDYDRSSWGCTNSKNSIVLNNFVDLEQFNYKLPKLEILKGTSLTGKKVLLFLGGVDQIKGIEPLLDAVCQLKLIFPEILLLLPGVEGIKKSITPFSWKNKIIETIRTLETSGHALLLPFTYTPEKLFATCDIVLFPALRPHFARPIIEAGAMKKPVIVSNVESCQELAIDNFNALVYEEHEGERIAAKIKEIYEQPYLLEKLGENGYQLTQERWIVAPYMDKLKRIYKSLTNAGKETV